jgi:hypothetical protein
VVARRTSREREKLSAAYAGIAAGSGSGPRLLDDGFLVRVRAEEEITRPLKRVYLAEFSRDHIQTPATNVTLAEEEIVAAASV